MDRHSAKADGVHGAAIPWGQLLEWHLIRGTRPDGSSGRRWKRGDLAAAVGADDRTLRNWIAGRTFPVSPDSIERELFGHAPVYEHARLEFCEAFAAARRRTRAAPAEPLIPPDRCLGRDAEIAALLAALTAARVPTVAAYSEPRRTVIPTQGGH